jgi:hypothetical protein
MATFSGGRGVEVVAVEVAVDGAVDGAVEGAVAVV